MNKAQSTAMNKALLQLIPGLSLAILFLWLIARQIRLEEFKRSLGGAEPAWIVTALCAWTIGYASRIQRWRLMLLHSNPGLKWTDCAGPLLSSFAVNNVLPFRAGDILRSFAYNNRLGTSAGVVMATVLIERLLDLLVVLALLGVGLTVVGTRASPTTPVRGSVLIAAAAAILILLRHPRLFAPVALAFGRIAHRVTPILGRKLIDEIHRGLDVLQHMAGGATFVRLVLWSLFVWVCEGCIFWLAALALPSLASAAGSWLALPVGTLATLIPSTPGYVGTFDYFVARAMVVAGNPATAAAAYALLIHAVLWLPSTLTGGLYMLLNPLKRKINLRAC